MLSRKSFFKKAAIAGAGFSLFDWMEPVQAAQLKEYVHGLSQVDPAKIAEDEDFWALIRQQYGLSSSVINLNNGGVSPQPKPVQDAHIRLYQYSNEAPSYTMWRIVEQGREPLRAKIAEMAGCSPDEIAFNRNTTEGLNTIIFGLNLKAGDEVVLTKFDYPNMMNAWKQREKRDGIKLNWVDLEMPVESDELCLKKFEAAITPKTKIVHITHMMNWTGQILPARKIADLAHAKGCEVIVDGSHSFAHIDYKIPDLDCDYYATSLHKWLCAPFGTGFMYMKKGKAKNVWALLSAPVPDADNITKFENIGTRSFAAEMAISNAADFQQLIGARRKEERLRFLRNYWWNKVAHLPGVKLHTSLKPQYSCAIATVSIENKLPDDIVSYLFEKKKVHVTNINHEGIKGIRVTPHVYTTLYELDKLAEGITELATAK